MKHKSGKIAKSNPLPQQRTNETLLHQPIKVEYEMKIQRERAYKPVLAINDAEFSYLQNYYYNSNPEHGGYKYTKNFHELIESIHI